MLVELESTGLLAWVCFAIAALLFAFMGLLTARLLRKKLNQKGAYQTAYECGEEPVGSIWVPFHPRYYVIAILFLLFEIEVALLYPWASVALVAQNKGGLSSGYSAYAFYLGLGFVILLALGLLYAWARGSLDWKISTNAPAQAHTLPAGSQAYHTTFNK